MKKITLILLLVSVVTYGQTDKNESLINKNEPPKKNHYNEIRFNGLYFSLGAIGLTYERTLNEESAIGTSVSFSYSGDFEYYISPYYRFYFGEKYASGFFVEGFGSLNSQGGNNDNKTDFALGVGFGGKWVTKGGFTGELGLGVGRNLFNGNIILEAEISIGYRF